MTESKGSVCPARYFCYDFPRFGPRVHHHPMKPRAGECDELCWGATANGASGVQRNFQREMMGMVVETRDRGYQRRWSPWGIDD